MNARDLPLREFWRDTKRPDVWAVEIREGKVVRCSGPLAIGMAELDGELLDSLDYSTEKAAWIRKHPDRFRPWGPSREVVWPT
jgi:hypothetical protein